MLSKRNSEQASRPNVSCVAGGRSSIRPPAAPLWRTSHIPMRLTVGRRPRQRSEHNGSTASRIRGIRARAEGRVSRFFMPRDSRRRAGITTFLNCQKNQRLRGFLGRQPPPLLIHLLRSQTTPHTRPPPSSASATAETSLIDSSARSSRCPISKNIARRCCTIASISYSFNLAARISKSSTLISPLFPETGN